MGYHKGRKAVHFLLGLVPKTWFDPPKSFDVGPSPTNFSFSFLSFFGPVPHGHQESSMIWRPGQKTLRIFEDLGLKAKTVVFLMI